MAIKLMSLFTRFFSDSRCTRYLEFAYILLLPIAVWALYRFSPFNNNDGFLDSWLYFGYAHNFQDLIERYGLPYYSVRFGLIFPLITLIEIFGPIKGYLAFVYSMYLLAGVPLYLLFRKHFSVHAAVLAYTILVSSVWFARTVLWTHPDAAAVPYLIAALALMFLEPGYRRVANFAIGVLMALAVNSNFFALSIGGLISVAYLTYFKNNLWSRIRQDVPWIIGGFALIFVAGSAGYYACCGQNYFTNTLNMLKWSARGEGAVYQAPIMALLNLHYIYLLPFFVVLMYVVSKQAKVESNRLLLAVTYYLIAVITFVVWYQFAFSTALLETYYYFSFFLVPSVVCIALIPVILAKASNSVTHSLNIALASFLLPPLIVAYGFPFSFDNVPIHLLLLSLGFALLLILLTTRYRKVTPYAIICFALSIQVSLLSTVIQGVPFYARMYGIADEFGFSR